jgi:hypothetical protein
LVAPKYDAHTSKQIRIERNHAHSDADDKCGGEETLQSQLSFQFFPPITDCEQTETHEREGIPIRRGCLVA